MALVKWEYGKWSNVMGYICGQCGCAISTVIGGIDHEEAIDSNGGVCPTYERQQSTPAQPDERAKEMER